MWAQGITAKCNPSQNSSPPILLSLVLKTHIPFFPYQNEPPGFPVLGALEVLFPLVLKTHVPFPPINATPLGSQVLNEADLSDALLVRVVLTRSDLSSAKIDGADFSDAVIDLPQKQALCKYAAGTNPVTGVDTRKSLGCGNRRGNAYGSPSSPLLSAPAQKFLDKDGFCDDSSGLCKGSF